MRHAAGGWGGSATDRTGGSRSWAGGREIDGVDRGRDRLAPWRVAGGRPSSGEGFAGGGPGRSSRRAGSTMIEALTLGAVALVATAISGQPSIGFLRRFKVGKEIGE